LWWIGGDPRLTPTARRTITSTGTELVLSVVSVWEIAIKRALGRFTLPESLEGFIVEALEANRIAPLPVSLAHALHVSHLPEHHRDPFDRMLVAQSIIEDLAIVTGDRMLAKYDVEVVW
jgi:PIN domain nuclease of toxin-antitoxin system